MKCKVCADEIEKYIYKCTLAPFKKKTGLCVLSHVCIMYACICVLLKRKERCVEGKRVKMVKRIRERKKQSEL